MAMGYMSSQDSTQAWVNWAEQRINTVSQLCLMIGTITLHKAGELFCKVLFGTRV